MINSFCEKAQKIIAVAESIAFDFGHSSVGSEHLLLAFLKVKDTKVKKTLESQNITYELIKKELLTIFEKKDSLPFYMEYTPSFKGILDNAIKNSKKLNEDKVSVEVLANSLFDEEDSLCKEILEKYNCDFFALKEEIKVERVCALDNIDELANINKKVINNPIKVFKREKELDLIITTLMRKQKPNVMLVGEPGVGKSALVEFLAYKIVKGEVNDSLKNKTIYELDIPSIVAGTKYRGEFEEKLKKIVKKIKEEPNAIIFIDEIHNIIGAGGAEGAIDASNILKPYLARGELHCIGATTYDEYIKIIEKEKAIERRFQLIKLDEPSEKDTFEILKGIKDDYERFHNISIDYEVCEKIVSLAKKYVNDRYFPDKAIDILDCSCVMAKKSNLSKLDEQSVIKTIENYYNVEINKNIIENKFEDEMNKKIIGQNKPINRIINRLKYIEKGLVDDNKPLGVFFFVGPSGVGKTQLAKEIAKYYFGKEDAYIKIDMSEFKETYSISKLIGSAPGYVGYDSQTLLVDKIRNHPHSVVILDEIEKANKDVLNLFLNVFDEGYFYDSHKRKIDFTNSIIIMTSNVGCEETKNIGFINQGEKEDFLVKKVESYFSKEFINRIDEIISFNNLDKESIRTIAKNHLKEYETKFSFEFNEESFIDELVNKEDIKAYGARFIKKEVKKNFLKLIENKVEVF